MRECIYVCACVPFESVDKRGGDFVWRIDLGLMGEKVNQSK